MLWQELENWVLGYTRVYVELCFPLSSVVTHRICLGHKGDGALCGGLALSPSALPKLSVLLFVLGPSDRAEVPPKLWFGDSALDSQHFSHLCILTLEISLFCLLVMRFILP